MTLINLGKKTRFGPTTHVRSPKGKVNDLISFRRQQQDYVGWIEIFYPHSVIVRLLPESAKQFGEARTVVNYKHFHILEEPLKSRILQEIN
ncbi:DUF2187 domain-containing protein [Listeria goaensis]|uniref:DUF2187 domain-containing protein n=1 Tax=Listeria goaensis TaxID=1649188 RepID=UPI000B58F8BF|nr:DUF2187 domain-containing protein [Listeria goaensis]